MIVLVVLPGGRAAGCFPVPQVLLHPRRRSGSSFHEILRSGNRGRSRFPRRPPAGYPRRVSRTIDYSRRPASASKPSMLPSPAVAPRPCNVARGALAHPAAGASGGCGAPMPGTGKRSRGSSASTGNRSATGRSCWSRGRRTARAWPSAARSGAGHSRSPRPGADPGLVPGADLLQLRRAGPARQGPVREDAAADGRTTPRGLQYEIRSAHRRLRRRPESVPIRPARRRRRLTGTAAGRPGFPHSATRASRRPRGSPP